MKMAKKSKHKKSPVSILTGLFDSKNQVLFYFFS
jgi:hypothetical protein